MSSYRKKYLKNGIKFSLRKKLNIQKTHSISNLTRLNSHANGSTRDYRIGKNKENFTLKKFYKNHKEKNLLFAKKIGEWSNGWDSDDKRAEEVGGLGIEEYVKVESISSIQTGETPENVNRISKTEKSL